eukprot:1323224-Amorphochlora_amoeboformis.AAC.1
MLAHEFLQILQNARNYLEFLRTFENSSEEYPRIPGITGYWVPGTGYHRIYGGSSRSRTGSIARHSYTAMLARVAYY